MTGPRPTGTEFALVAAVVSGFAVFTNGLAIQRFDDATVYTTAKNLIAGAVVLAALVVHRRTAMGPDAGLPPGAVPRLAVVAVVGGAVPFVLFFEGLARATSTNAAFIHKTLVIWVALGAWAVLRERVTAMHVGAIALLVAGQTIVTGRPPTSGGTGELMILGATLLWALEVLVVKRLLPTVPAHAAAAARMAGGAVLLVVWLGVRGGLSELVTLAPRQWAWLLLTGSTLSIFVLTWYTALSLAPAVDVTSILVLGAVITGLLNTGFRGVPLTIDSTGYVLLAAGAAAIVWTGRNRPLATLSA